MSKLEYWPTYVTALIYIVAVLLVVGLGLPFYTWLFDMAVKFWTSIFAG